MVKSSKRDLALGVISDFRGGINEHPDRIGLTRLVAETLERLLRLQGSREDRPHLAKSLCQISTALRSHGCPDVALAILSDAAEEGVSDEYTVAEIIQCHVLNKDVAAAEATMEVALRMGLFGGAACTILIGAFAAARDLDGVARIFNATRLAGVATTFNYCAMIAAVGRAGLVSEAQRIFDLAREDGKVDAGVYSALLSAYGRRGALDHAQRVFDDAERAGVTDVKTYTGLVAAYARAGTIAQARTVFHRAVGAGFVDSRLYDVMIQAYARRGRLREARKLLARARASGNATRETSLALYGRRMWERRASRVQFKKTTGSRNSGPRIAAQSA